MNRHIQKVPTLSIGRRLASLLAIPIFIAGFLNTQTLLRHLTVYPGDIFGWVALLAGILAAGAWVELVVIGPPRWVALRLLRAGHAIGWLRPEIRPFVRPLTPAWKNTTKVGLALSLIVWWIVYATGTSLLGHSTAPIKPADNALAVTFCNIAVVIWVLIVLVAPDVSDWVQKTWRR